MVQDQSRSVPRVCRSPWNPLIKLFHFIFNSKCHFQKCICSYYCLFNCLLNCLLNCQFCSWYVLVRFFQHFVGTSWYVFSIFLGTPFLLLFWYVLVRLFQLFLGTYWYMFSKVVFVRLVFFYVVLIPLGAPFQT